MLAIFQGRLSLLVCLIFPVLLFGGLIMQHLVSGMRRDLEMVEYAAERGPVEEAPQPPPPEERLPGYLMLTQADYDEIVARLRQELEAEQKQS